MRKFLAIVSAPFLLIHLASGCGSGGGSDRSAPEVVSTAPESGARDVDVESAIDVTFSENIAPDSISNETVRVVRLLPSVSTGYDDPASDPVEGELHYDGATRSVHFTPAGGLALFARYEVELTSGIRDVAGNALVPSGPVAFQTRDGVLSAPAKIGLDPGPLPAPSGGPFIAVAPNGSAIAMWFDPLLVVSPHALAWYSRYDPATGIWTPQSVVTDPRGRTATLSGVVLDAQGHAFALFGSTNVDQDAFFVLDQRAGGDWRPSVSLDSPSVPYVWTVGFVMDGLGNVFVAWVDGAIHVTRYHAGQDLWGQPIVVGVGTSDVRVAAGAAGDAMLTWRRFVEPDPASPELGGWTAEAARFDPGSDSWKDPVRISGVPGENSAPSSNINPQEPHVAIDRQGNALAGWTQNAGPQLSETWTNVYDRASDRWGEPSRRGGGDRFGVGLSRRGDGVLVSGSGGQCFGSSVHDAGTGTWTGGQHVCVDGTVPAALMATDGGGRSFLLACSASQDLPMVLLRREPGEGWGEPRPVSGDGDVTECAIALDDRGRATIVWRPVPYYFYDSPVFVSHFR